MRAVAVPVLLGEVLMLAVRVIEPADVPACKVGICENRAVVEPFEMVKGRSRTFAGTKTSVESSRPTVSGVNWMVSWPVRSIGAGWSNATARTLWPVGADLGR